MLSGSSYPFVAVAAAINLNIFQYNPKHHPLDVAFLSGGIATPSLHNPPNSTFKWISENRIHVEAYWGVTERHHWLSIDNADRIMGNERRPGCVAGKWPRR